MLVPSKTTPVHRRPLDLPVGSPHRPGGATPAWTRGSRSRHRPEGAPFDATTNALPAIVPARPEWPGRSRAEEKIARERAHGNAGPVAPPWPGYGRHGSVRRRGLAMNGASSTATEAGPSRAGASSRIAVTKSPGELRKQRAGMGARPRPGTFSLRPNIRVNGSRAAQTGGLDLGIPRPDLVCAGVVGAVPDVLGPHDAPDSNSLGGDRGERRRRRRLVVLEALGRGDGEVTAGVPQRPQIPADDVVARREAGSAWYGPGSACRIRSGRDPEEIEIGIAGGKLPLQHEHVVGEGLEWSQDARCRVRFAHRLHVDDAIEAGEHARSLHAQGEERFELLDLSSERASGAVATLRTIYFLLSIDDNKAKVSWRWPPKRSSSRKLCIWVPTGILPIVAPHEDDEWDGNSVIRDSGVRASVEIKVLF